VRRMTEFIVETYTARHGYSILPTGRNLRRFRRGHGNRPGRERPELSVRPRLPILAFATFRERFGAVQRLGSGLVPTSVTIPSSDLR
jgi:hypothetical protein